MSTTDLTMAPSAVEQPPAPPRRRPGPAPPWARVALACTLLGLAGGVRWWQARRVEAALARGHESPFPLRELPMAVGPWRVPGRHEEALDPEVVRILGCTDYLRRHYVNEQTGVAAEVLVLYGPATIAHRPEICYPGAGFEPAGAPQARQLPVPGGRASFLSLVFGRGEGAAVDRQQVLYALRYDGRWTHEVHYKRIARLPGLYKIQLTRRVGDRERLDVGNPCEAFLEALLPEIERRVAGAPATAPRR